MVFFLVIHTYVCVCVCGHLSVFVLNHASPDDFQPSSLRELHQSIAKEFESSKLQVASGVSLFNSGVIPTGVGFPSVKPYKKADEVNPADINLHLLPSNPSLADSYSVHTTSRPEKQGSVCVMCAKSHVGDMFSYRKRPHSSISLVAYVYWPPQLSAVIRHTS